MRFGLSIWFLPLLAACTAAPEVTVVPPPAVDIPALDAPAPPPEARRVEEFDTTTEDQREAALDVSEEGVLLGSAVVSLGDPGEAGFWVKAALVTAPGTGRVALLDDEKSVEVALLPSEGSGRASLAVLRLLDVPLTDLVEVNIYENQ